MEAKVTKRFKDKFTGGVYVPGDLFKGETARIEQLITLGYIEIKKPKKSTKKVGD